MNSVLRLAAGLRDRGLHVRFVCPPESEVEGAARDRGLEVHPIPLARGNRIGNAGRLARILAEYPVDLVDSHGSRDREALTLLGLLRRLPVPVVFTRRSFPRTTLLESWLAARVATRVVAISEPVAQALRARGVARDKLAVIHTGVLLDRIDGTPAPAVMQRVAQEIGWESSRRTLAIVARPKDQTVVLEALNWVATPVRLVLAGLHGRALTGPLPGIPNRHVVVRLPFRPDVRPFYQLVELVLHPSRWDALPQAVLEAMALGKPVIASRATGNAVIIRDGEDGLLVEAMDPAALGPSYRTRIGGRGPRGTTRRRGSAPRARGVPARADHRSDH